MDRLRERHGSDASNWEGMNGLARDTDPLLNTGLAERLEQHSRRGGVALGAAMALCIVIALAGFIYLYTHLDFFPDARVRATNPAAGGLVGSSGSVTTRQLTPVASATLGTPGAKATTIAGETVSQVTTPAAMPTPSPAASGTPGTVGPTPTPAFTANYRIVGGQAINFRAEAGTSSNRLKSFPPGTELQYLGQSQDVSGDKWLRMRDRTNTEGWVREIDVEKLPG